MSLVLDTGRHGGNHRRLLAGHCRPAVWRYQPPSAAAVQSVQVRQTT